MQAIESKTDDCQIFPGRGGNGPSFFFFFVRVYVCVLLCVRVCVRIMALTD
jgi:hypothetical protein